MHAYLITGATPEERGKEIEKRLQALGASKFDTTQLALEPEEEHIGIDAVRIFTKRLLFAPVHGAHTIGIIRQAQTLTPEAQNALLKLLEEPPPHARIFCETENPDRLLPTIASRCEIVRLARTEEKGTTLVDTKKTILTILDSSTAEKLTFVETITKDRVTAKLWVADALAASRDMMLADYHNGNISPQTGKITQLIRLLTQAQRELTVNVNPRLVVDTIFLSL